MNKPGLGRGLGALLSSAPGTEETISEIPIDQIAVNPNQPRKLFDSESLSELAASIRSSGVIQPVVVRRHGAGYQLIAGERRWRAARQAGLARIPAVVREATDAQSLEIALVENLLREDLNPMEEAEAYQKLLAQFGWTQEELAQRVGLDRSSIANALRLLRLPEPIQADLRGGRLTMGHALVLLAHGPLSAARRADPPGSARADVAGAARSQSTTDRDQRARRAPPASIRTGPAASGRPPPLLSDSGLRAAGFRRARSRGFARRSPHARRRESA